MYIAEGMTPCQEHDAAIWFAKPHSRRTKRAKELCGTCPEQTECLSSTMRFEKRAGATQPAVFAGLTEAERAKLYMLPVVAIATA